MNSIDEIIDELESGDYERNADLIPWLGEKITESDFESAINKITDVLERG